MNYTLLNDFSQIDSNEWNALLKNSIQDTPFLRYEYQNTWWQHKGGGEWKDAKLLLVTARENNQLIGIAPLFIATYENEPALLLNGSIEISDYLDVIVKKDDHAKFISGLLDFLASKLTGAGEPRPYDWKKIDWYNLPDDSPTLLALKEEATKRGWTHHEEVYRPTPRVALNGSFEDYLSRIEKKQRHEIRRKMRRAAESELNVKFVLVGQDADIEKEINTFFELMIQDPNKAEFLHPAMREQMTAVLHEAYKNNYLWLGFLEIDGVKTAASLNFDYENKLWGYNSGVSRGHMDLSPGWVLLSHTIQWCCDNGRYEFDFMRGDEDYKYRFGGVNRFVMRSRIIR
ncbi:MAG: GNAT family N-acetyltransferase [Anaerolineales bacterium]|nr:GNAT family N-acetyltransferase [Anaerolineales bacterium]